MYALRIEKDETSHTPVQWPIDELWVELKSHNMYRNVILDRNVTRFYATLVLVRPYRTCSFSFLHFYLGIYRAVRPVYAR